MHIIKKKLNSDYFFITFLYTVIFILQNMYVYISFLDYFLVNIQHLVM